MATPKQPPDGAGKGPRGSNRVPGVWKLPERGGRPKPWGVSWSVREWSTAKQLSLRKVKKKFFATETDRDRRYTTLCAEKRAGTLRSLSGPEIDEYMAIKAAIGDVPWQNVVAGYHTYCLEKGLVQTSVTVQERVDDYLQRMKTRRDAKECAAGTYTQHKHKLKLFAAAFGGYRLDALDPGEIRKWFESLGLAAAGTFNNYRKILLGFLNEAVEDGLLSIARHPLRLVKPRKERQKPVRILTIPQIGALFHTAMTHLDADGKKRYARAVRRLALETFAGVRYSSANRLAATDIKTEDRGILHPADTIKTDKRHYSEGYPDVLWEWLAVAPAEENLQERDYLRLKSELFLVAGVPHPKNCLRKSFASYMLAVNANPGVVAYMLCHRNQQKLWHDYKGAATKAEGLRFEKLTPLAVSAAAAEWTEILRANQTTPTTAAAPSPSAA